MFHHEFAALEWRMRELAPFVDDFVVVESVLTHSGLSRELIYPERDPRFDVSGTRLHAFVDRVPPAGDDIWRRERHQRETVWTLGAASISTGDDDLIIISDADEVPFPEFVDSLAWSSFETPISMRPHWFNFDWNTYLGPWTHASIRFYPARVLRDLTDAEQTAMIGDASVPGREAAGLHGWHASWFGDDDFVLDKLASYAHAADEADRKLSSEGVAGIRRRRDSGFNLHGDRRVQDNRPRLPKYAHLVSTIGLSEEGT